jgi:hypothetical protein
MFQITGDRRYIDLAWRATEAWFLRRATNQLRGNFAREYAVELVLQYDWLYPGLSSTQRATFLSKLNEMFVALTNSSSPNAPSALSRFGSDRGGLLRAGVPVRRNRRSQPGRWTSSVDRLLVVWRQQRVIGPRRNAILDYVTMAAGGEWIEGSEYNLGTVRLLLLGAEGIRTATGTDHFPEITRWVSSAALRPLYVTTPDLRQFYQWGDTEDPFDFRGQLYAWQTTNGILAGLSDRNTSPYIQQLVLRLSRLNGETGNRSSDPWARMFLTFDPYAGGSPPDDLPPGWFAAGQGLRPTGPDGTMRPRVWRSCAHTPGLRRSSGFLLRRFPAVPGAAPGH